MYYVIVAEDAKNTEEKRRQARVAHLQRLHVLNQQGRLLLAGPTVQDHNESDQVSTGSLIVADFESLSEAQKWADADPYVQAGVFTRFIVKPFTKVLP